MNAPESTLSETVAALQRALHSRAAGRVSDAVVRGAAAGLALRGGLHLVSYVLGLLMKKKRGAKGQSPPATALLQDTLRWGAFLGCFSGSFTFLDEVIAALGGRERTAAWRAMLAGAAAGPALLLTGRDADHTSLALYVFLRGVTLLVRCGNLPTAPAWKRRLLTPTRYRHGDVALMCLSSCQLLYSWIVLPSTLPVSYIRFLNKHGGKDTRLVEAVREMSWRATPEKSALEASGKQLKKHGPLPALRGTQCFEHYHGNIPCEFLHPGMSCTAHILTFLPQAYLRALPVYLPVYAVPAALVHRKRLLRPGVRGELWAKMGMGVLRSSAFLALYCALAWRGACTGWQLTGGTSGRVIAMSCWVAGLATFVEKKSRRMELALYCLSRAVEAFALTLVAWGWVSKKAVPRRLDVVLFSAAAAAICHCYSDHNGARRDVFRSKYLAVFDFIFGNSGFTAEDSGIRHVPSNQELIALATMRLEQNGMRLVRSVAGLAQLAEGSNGGEGRASRAMSLSRSEGGNGETSQSLGSVEESKREKDEEEVAST